MGEARPNNAALPNPWGPPAPPAPRRTPSRRSLGWNRNKFRAPPRKEASRRLDVNNFIDDYIKIYSSDCIIHPCFVVPTHPCVFKKKERKKREITDASRR